MPNFSRQCRSREKSTKTISMTPRSQLSEKFSSPPTMALSSLLLVPENNEDDEKIDSDDDFSIPESIESYLEALSLKRQSKRADGLSGIVGILSTTVKTEFVQKEFATLLYMVLNCIKKGSSQDLDLAANALGLLALTCTCQDNLREVCDESIPVLIKGINSKMKTSSILYSLAIMTFLCSNNCVETEQMMQVIWSFIQSKFGTDLADSKYPIELLNGAIYAWLFLLASLDGWRLSYKNWQGGISYFRYLLRQSDETVSVAAAEALALIFELENIDKFLTPNDYSGYVLDDSDANSPVKFSILKEKLSNEVLNELEKLSKRADKDVLKYFKDGSSPQIRKKIGESYLNLSSWSQKIQMNFMRRFLGHAGFLAHIKGNEVVQKAFKFRPKTIDLSRNELYESTPEQVIYRCVMPPALDPTYLTSKEKKKYRRRNKDIICKGQTIVRDKSRLSKLRNNEWDTDGCLQN